MLDSSTLLIFRLEQQRYALSLSAVTRVIHSAEITPLPGAPVIVSGIIDLQGTIIPMLDIRKRLHLPEHVLCADDQFVIARLGLRAVGLVVDQVEGVQEYDHAQVVAANDIVPGSTFVEGVIRLDESLVFIHDLEKFLEFDEMHALDQAMVSYL